MFYSQKSLHLRPLYLGRGNELYIHFIETQSAASIDVAGSLLDNTRCRWGRVVSEKFHDAWGGQVASETMLKGSLTLSGFWSELSWKGPSHCLLIILAAWGWLLLDAPEVVRWVFRTCCGDWRFEVKVKGKDSRSSKSVGLQGEKV